LVSVAFDAMPRFPKAHAKGKDHNAPRLAAAGSSIARTGAPATPVQTSVSTSRIEPGLSSQDGARNRHTCQEFETDFLEHRDTREEFETDFVESEGNSGKGRHTDLLSEFASSNQSFDENHFARFSSHRTTSNSFQRQYTGDSRDTMSFRSAPKCDRWLSFEQRLTDSGDARHTIGPAEESKPYDGYDGDEDILVASSSSLLKYLYKSAAKSHPCGTTDGTDFADGACLTDFTEERLSFDLTCIKQPRKGITVMDEPQELADVMLEDAQSHTSGLQEATTLSTGSSSMQPGAEDTFIASTTAELPTMPQVPTHQLARPGQHARHTSHIQEGSSQNDASSLGVFKPLQPNRPKVSPGSAFRLRHISAAGGSEEGSNPPRAPPRRSPSEAGQTGGPPSSPRGRDWQLGESPEPGGGISGHLLQGLSEAT